MHTTSVLDLTTTDTAGAAPAPAGARRALNRRGPAPLALEPRIMFDGATADAAVAAAKAAADAPVAERAADGQDRHVAAAVLPPAPQRQEIVFIEDNIPDYQKLVAGAAPGVDVVVLDHTRDGLQQMLGALAGHAPVDAIHLVTHGDQGRIQLGTRMLSSASLDGARGELGALGSHLAANGDLLIYGCDVAAGPDGAAFVDRIASLTGADVAASSDVTGSRAFGNWTLEAHSGQVETAAQQFDRAGWDGALVTKTVYDAEQKPLTFDASKATSIKGTGNGTKDGDVMLFSNVITVGGQKIDAVITTKLNNASLNDYDSIENPSPSTEYFQPTVKNSASGGNATFTIAFYLGGTYTKASPTGTSVTLQHVVVNSYDIDSSGGTDRQFQSFQGFAKYEVSTQTALSVTPKADGSVTFQTTSSVKNDDTYADPYRVRVFYDSMSSFTVNAGISGASGSTAYFAFDFSLGKAWSGAIKSVDSPAPRLTYSTTTFVEAAANDGAISTSSTITLANGAFSGSNGAELAGVTFSNTPAGLTAHVTRTSDTTATLTFTGKANAHANANDISNVGVSFGDAAFSGTSASAVTGASRADIVVDFADPAANSAPTASGTAITTSEDTVKSGSLPAATDVDGDTVTYSKASNPAHGTVVVNANGTYTYTPSANYNGSDSFTYTVSDGNGGSNTYTVSVTVNPVNDAPTAGGTAISTNEDTVKSGSLPAATDVDGDTVTYSKATDPAHGTVVVNGNGTYTYTPATGYDGADSFTYTVSDGNGGSNTYTVAITVTPVNHAPTAGGTSITTDEDTAKSGSLPAASDADNDTVTYSKASNPAHGTVVVNNDGTYTYTPAANYNGSDSFTYTVSDGNGGANTYTVAITVKPVNDAPTAGGTSITTNEDTVKNGSLPAATDVDGDTVTYSKATDPAHGALVVNSDGTYTYTPATGYDGADSFTYTVSDGNGGSNTYTVAITVTPVNHAPTAGGASITTDEDTAKSGSLPAASDADNDTVTYSKASNPAHGTVVVNGDGTYTYTPAANYNGADSFTYTVSDGNGGANTYTVAITVKPVNDAPTAGGTSISTNEDTVKSGSLPAATDVDGDTVTYGKATDPAHGTVVVHGDGTYTYTPAANYNGADSFTYTVSDGNGGSNTYTVAITVSPVNDAPTAGNGTITTDEDTAKSGSLPAASDADNDLVTYSKASNPAHGTVVVNGDGTYTYTPAANYNGADSFTYTVSDGNGGSNTYTVSITVNPVNDAPTASGTSITTNEDTVKSGSLPAATDADGDTVTYGKATDPAHGTLVVHGDGTYTYTPAANYNGSDSFTYTVSDGNGGANTYKVAITVSPVNDAPTAGNDTITTNEDTAKSGSLPAASDADGDTVTYGKATDPAHGAVVVHADGTYTYTPAANYNGADSFTYTVSDGNGGSNTYTVSITVNPVNDAPTAGNDTITTNEDTAKSGSLPAATDADGDTVTYGKATDPAHGTLVVHGDGTYTYTPAANYNGSDSFTYTVSDGNGGANTYKVAITVSPVNDAPTAGNDTITTDEDTAKSGSLPAASDADGDTVTYGKATDPAHGAVVVHADGTYTYTPAANYNGADSFTYTVSDGNGGSNTYTVSITVNPVNDAPTAGNDTITTDEDTAKSGSLPAATDADGDTVTYSKATDPAHGTLVVNANGTYTYTPAANYHGADSFTYTVSDGNGASNTYTVNITVDAVNDVPVAGDTSIATPEDTPKSGTLPAASDADGDTPVYGKGSDPAHGSVVIDAQGNYTYTPAKDFNGSDSFTYTVSDGKGGSNTYTVSITVDPVNDAPVAGDTGIATPEDTPKTGTLPAATDAEGDTPVYGKASDPAHGTVVIDAQGNYTYTPAKDFNGADSFTYTVTDGSGASNTYTVTVTVEAVNDAPVAADVNVSTPGNTPRSGSLPVATDVDGDVPVYGKGSDPAHGSVVIDAQGHYTYTPARNFSGADSFTYTVSDGKGGSNTYTVNIGVGAINGAPEAADASLVTAEDTPATGALPAATDKDGDTVVYGKGSDPAHGSVVIDARGNYTYTPDKDYHGADGFTYTVSDGQGGRNTYRVEVTVTPVNDAPAAADTAIGTNEDAPVSGTLPAAADVDGDKVVYGKGADPAHGSVVIDAAGNYTYTPAKDFHGADSFTYTVSDGNGGSTTYTVRVTVAPFNDAPVAADAAIRTDEDAPVSGTLPAASDVDGDKVVYGKGADPAHGSVVIDAAGNYTYTPAKDFHGADSFTYTVSDGHGGANTYTVRVTVAPVNDAPVAHGGASGAGTVGTPLAPVTVPVFTDIDSPSISYTATLADGAPLPSWLGFDPDTRTFTGTPPQGSQGSYTVRVTGSDGQLAADAVVTITIGAPAAPAQSVSIDSMTKDTGASSTDFVTADGSAGRTVAGGIGAPLATGQVVQVSFDGGATWTTASVSGTRWTSVDGGAHDTNWTINARVVDGVTGAAGPAAAQRVTLEAAGPTTPTTPTEPTTPTTPTTPVAPTVGNVPTDSATPVLGGTATVGAGEHLEVRVGDTTYVVPVQNGTWTLDLSTARPVAGNPLVLEPGRDYQVVASVTDAAGNVREGSNTGTVNIGLPVPPQEPPPVPQPEPVVPAAPAPAPTVVAPAAPLESAAGVVVRGETGAPGSLAAGDSVQFGSGIGTRIGAQSFIDLRGAALSDVYTRSEGFRTVVAKAEEPALVLFQGVPDQFVDANSRLSLTIPADAFAHTQPAAVVRLVAVLQDGRPLPQWVGFNGQTGQFTGDVPRDFKGELKIKLIARDVGGREAAALFRINVGADRATLDSAKPAPAGKPGLTSQLRAAPARTLPGRH